MKITFIYTLEDLDGNIRYIGKSNDPYNRLRKHCSPFSLKKLTHKNNWIKLLLYEGSMPIVKIIDEVPIDSWKYWEKY